MNPNLKALILIAAVLCVPGTTASGAVPPAFSIRCDLDGKHGADPDRLPVEREVQLLRDAVADTFPKLPEDLKTVASKITFVIDHKHHDLTKLLFGGWSAEDDDAYKFPDRELFPRGTIKVNLTEHFIQLLHLSEQLSGDPTASSRLRDGMHGIVRMVIAHELKHAQQYQTKPLRDLGHTQAFTNGLADLEILDETRQKVEYEHQAFRFGRSFLTQAQMLDAVQGMKAFAAAHPSDYRPGGPYSLCGGDDAAFGREALLIERGGEFSPRQRLFVAGQYLFPNAVVELKKLNDQLSEQGLVRRPDSLQRIENEHRQIMNTWTELRGDSARWASAEEISAILPQMPTIIKRFESEQVLYAKRISQLEKAQ